MDSRGGKRRFVLENDDRADRPTSARPEMEFPARRPQPRLGSAAAPRPSIVGSARLSFRRSLFPSPFFIHEKTNTLRGKGGVTPSPPPRPLDTSPHLPDSPSKAGFVNNAGLLEAMETFRFNWPRRASLEILCLLSLLLHCLVSIGPAGPHWRSIMKNLILVCVLRFNWPRRASLEIMGFL